MNLRNRQVYLRLQWESFTWNSLDWVSHRHASFAPSQIHNNHSDHNRAMSCSSLLFESKYSSRSEFSDRWDCAKWLCVYVFIRLIIQAHSASSFSFKRHWHRISYAYCARLWYMHLIWKAIRHTWVRTSKVILRKERDSSLFVRGQHRASHMGVM